MTTGQDIAEDDAPLKLFDLADRMDAETYEWLRQHDISYGVREEVEDDVAANLFDTAEEDDEIRVLQWTSSRQNPNGFGGFDNDLSESVKEDESITVEYILSSSSGGHGDDVWAASRHISNLMADPNKCSTLIGTPQSSESHPLLGKRFLELGAGAGIPSMTAYKCGAHVVCTDQAIPNRIRCLAEAAERNCRDMREASHIRVHPYSWGDPVESVLPDDGEKFDVVVASDCIYNPQAHAVLLKSIQMLMATDGVSLLPFALHGNTDDDSVWSVAGTAQTMGFHVEQLKATQLAPQIKTMNTKRGLVHVLRLTQSKC